MKMKKKEIEKKIKKRTISILIVSNIFLLSALLNMTAVAYNGGKMPVNTDYPFETDRHFSFQEPNEVNLYPLADIFEVGDYFYYSIGDVGLYFFGGVITILCLINLVDYIKWIKLKN